MAKRHHLRGDCRIRAAMAHTILRVRQEERKKKMGGKENQNQNQNQKNKTKNKKHPERNCFLR